MRILIHDFAGHAFQVQLSRELAKRGHSVKHVYPDGLPGPKGPLQWRDGDAAEFSIQPIPLTKTFDKYSARKRWRAHRQYAAELCDVIKRETPELVLSGNTPIDVQAELLWHCRRRGSAFVHWVQDVYCRAIEFYLSRKLPQAAKACGWLFGKVEALVARHSNAVIVISPAFETLLASWGVESSKISTIENWAPLSKVGAPERHNAWREQHGLSGQTVFLYSGTLGMKHRPDLLYKLAEAVGEEVQVVVVTEGVGREYLASLPALPNLTLLPFQAYSRIPEVLATADVLVATLEAEAGDFAVPSKVLTYLAAGRPVLLAAPDRNLASAVVKRSGGGIAVDPDNNVEWCIAARKLARDTALRQSAARNALGYAEQHFDISRIAHAFEAVFDRALSDPVRPRDASVVVSEG